MFWFGNVIDPLDDHSFKQFFAFADKEYVCDCMCGKPIEKGQLMSVGTREVVRLLFFLKTNSSSSFGE